MENWPGGVRERRALSNGLMEQLVTLRDSREVLRWEAIILRKLVVQWQGDMALTLNGHRLGFQSPEQRDEFAKTFPPHQNMLEPYAVFYQRGEGALLVLGSKPVSGSPAYIPPVEGQSAHPGEDLERLSVPQLRTKLIERNLPVELRESRAVLIERLRALPQPQMAGVE